MRILLKKVSLAGGLGSKEYPSGVTVQQSRQVHVASSLNASSIQAFDRGNVKTTITFCVTRQHGSIQGAQNFILSHCSSLSGLYGCAEFIEETGQITYLQNTVLSHISGSLNGVATTHTYTLVGGILSNQES